MACMEVDGMKVGFTFDTGAQVCTIIEGASPKLGLQLLEQVLA